MASPQPSLFGRQKLSLGWIHLNEVVGAMSAIDLSHLNLRDLDDARQFALEYGFDVDDPQDREQVHAAHREAVQFIVDTFLEPTQAELIPPEVADPADVLQLLVYASRHLLGPDPRRLWSCAVLKVMHCVFYVDNNLKLRHFATIRRQVFAALDKVLIYDGERHYLSDGDSVLPVRLCERKSNKGRRSILLKLLQKAAYVAADICDHLGLRLVFDTRIECLLALRVLQRSHVLSVVNVESQRTRNTLLDLAAARKVFERFQQELDDATDYPHELLAKMDAELIAATPELSRDDNPHSHSGYHSLQLTVRKMIRLPAHVEAEADAKDDEGAAAGEKFLFEYEIQLMDWASYQHSQNGPASHGAYKQRQVDTARKRVFGKELLAWLAASARSAAVR